MKSKILFCTLLMLLYTAITVKAQKPVYPKPNSSDRIPFGKKLPLPVLNARNEIVRKACDEKVNGLPYTSFDTVLKQFIVHTPGQKSVQYALSDSYSTNSAVQTATNAKNADFCFHLTKD